MNRWLKLANKVSQGSNHNHQLGAVVVRGGAVLAVAFNISRPYGIDNGGRHAEERVLHNKDGRNFKGATLYVCRWGSRASKPCPKCMKAIIEAGIKKIVYFNYVHEMIVERV